MEHGAAQGLRLCPDRQEIAVWRSPVFQVVRHHVALELVVFDLKCFDRLGVLHDLHPAALHRNGCTTEHVGGERVWKVWSEGMVGKEMAHRSYALAVRLGFA